MTHLKTLPWPTASLQLFPSFPLPYTAFSPPFSPPPILVMGMDTSIKLPWGSFYQLHQSPLCCQIRQFLFILHFTLPCSRIWQIWHSCWNFSFNWLPWEHILLVFPLLLRLLFSLLGRSLFLYQALKPLDLLPFSVSPLFYLSQFRPMLLNIISKLMTPKFTVSSPEIQTSMSNCLLIIPPLKASSKTRLLTFNPSKWYYPPNSIGQKSGFHPFLLIPHNQTTSWILLLAFSLM